MPLFLANQDLLTPERYVCKGETFRADTAPAGCINLETNEIVGTDEKHLDNLALIEVKPTTHRCVLFGDGPSLMDGIRWALTREADFDVVCVNRAGLKWCFPMLAWVSRHADHFPEWLAVRKTAGLQLPVLVSDMQIPQLQVLHASNSTRSGSGEYALEFVQRLGYTRIVLAGFDLNAHPYSVYAKKFSTLKAETTRALHGKSCEIFGAPEMGWFEE
jgi:hypothetical protein